jgi:2-iminobutanoate/2-iminopropanoate deaminase
MFARSAGVWGEQYVQRMRSIRTEKAPAPVAGAPYSQAVAVQPGEVVYVSGQVPVDPTTGQLIDDDIRLQTALVLRNLAAILAAAGSGLDQVVKTTVYLRDFDDFGAMNEVYAQAFAEHAPARATIGVAVLPLGARVEIEAVAIIPDVSS